jgi:D-3-phosphoglycerate dehydrogenase / 2-oxoglutarate reductase
MIMKALITEKFHPILQSTFEEYGIECIIYENIDTAGVQDIIEDFDILIVNSKILVNKNMLDKAKNLKAIGRVGSGMEIIDTEYCSQKGIFVCSAPEGNANAVAEHAMAMLLAGFNNLFHAQIDLLNGKWLRETHRGQELKGKTIAIIGFGHTGQAFAQKLKGFEVTVLAHDILPIKVSESYIKEATLEEIFEKAVIISLHLPLNEQTFHYVNADFLQKFKHKISIINTSRGKIIDFQALKDAIDVGLVTKAMIDVFENEPFEKIETVRKYIQEKKLYLTPHIAGWTFESYFLLSKLVSEKIVNQLFNKLS